jgi:hypothetical protein
MSDAYAAWCTRARELLKASNTKSNQMKSQFEIVNSGALSKKPDELTDDEWSNFLATRKIATEMFTKGDASKPNARFPSVASTQMGEFVDAMDKLKATMQARETAFTLATTHIAFPVLGKTGVASLKSSSDPVAALDEVQSVVVARDKVASDLDGLTDHYDAKDRASLAAAVDDALADLDPDTARAHLKKLAAFRKAAADDKKQVADLQRTHDGQADAPTTLPGWRELAKRERDFDALKAQIEKAIAVGETSKFLSKKQQVAAIRGDIEAALKDWPAKSVTDKLDKSNGIKGNFPWLQERLTVLLGKTASNADDIEADLVKQEWDAFLDNAKDKWDEYVGSNYNRSKAGLDADGPFLTNRVRAKITTTNSFKSGGRTFTKAPSDTTGISYHVPMIKVEHHFVNTKGQLRKSFVLHV